MDRGTEGSVLAAGLLEAEVEIGAEAGTIVFRLLSFPAELLRLSYSDILDDCNPVSEEGQVAVVVVLAVTAAGLVDEFVAAEYAVEVAEDLPEA